MTRLATNTPIASATLGDSSPRLGVFNSLARRMLLAGLARLREGSVTLVEGGCPRHFGDADADLAATVTVHHARFYRRIALGGSLGAAESYMDGDWSCDDLTALLRIFTRTIEAGDRLSGVAASVADFLARLARRLRRNTKQGSRRNIADHYDLGNDFFALWLDETMTYSSGIFETPQSTLAEASTAKLDRLCRKLALTPTDHVLEIGAGWGSFALHAAGRYGCRVTTTTISQEQHDLARQRIAAAGLADRVTVLRQDYRDLTGQYDKIVSIEMIEAVGHEYLGVYFGKCASLLKPDGAMALQAITMNEQRYERYRRSADFIQRYVFPGSCCPSLSAMTAAIARASDLKVFHLEDIGPHYARTLGLWRQRFVARLDEVRQLGYPPRFLRLWEYYLSYCDAGFEERYIGDVQMILTKPRCRVACILPPLN